MARRQPSPDQIRDAQRLVGTAMGACLAMWYAPVVAGVACNVAERQLIGDVLRTLGRPPKDDTVDALFWFHRKRMLLFNATTYLPWVGTALQVLEVYSLGQFVIACASDPQLRSLKDEAELAREWDRIEEFILSGDRVAETYEEFTETPFPTAIRASFVASVDAASVVYRGASRVPGLQAAQEFLGEGVRSVLGYGKSIRDRWR